MHEQFETPDCPNCGSAMELKVAQRGSRAGATFWGCPRFPKCRGTRRFSLRVGRVGGKGTRPRPSRASLGGTRPSLREGNFVWTYDRAVLGKLVELTADRALVRIVHSLADQETHEYKPAQLDRAILSRHTRVYLLNEGIGNWSTGRIVDYDAAAGEDGVAYEVRMQGGERLLIQERDLIVRCFAPIRDPTESLAAGAIESQYFYDRRLRALEGTLTQLNAAASASGLVSGSVDLMPHQVHIVRRISEDSVQRYLLADEVGLGKTIEAGAVVRQFLTDMPSSRVVVVAPASLLWQWEKELREKFDVEFDGEQVKLCDLHSIAELGRRGQNCDLLVIDEAHRIISREGPAAEDYRHLAKLAHSAERILLLTATPVLSDDAATLALLHLIDRGLYRVEDTEGFRSRLDRRQRYAELALALDPEVPMPLLVSTVKQIAALLTDDPAIARFSTALLSPDLGRGEQRAALRDLRFHISDTYRLDRRIMRTRRADAGWSQRSCPLKEAHSDPDERIGDLVIRLEQWRADALDTATSESEQPLSIMFQQLVEAMGCGLEAYASTLQSRLSELRKGARAAFAEELDWHRESLSICRRDQRGASRLERCVDTLRKAIYELSQGAKGDHQRIVAFTSSTEFAQALESALYVLRPTSVFAVTAELGQSETEERVRSFVKSRWPAILVADRSAEEGLNLQAADGLFHMDLPMAPERVEQRIGRLDRLGRKLPEIPTYVMLPSQEPGSFWLAWHELLKEGFGIYSRSISDVHFLLDDLQNRIRLELFRRGAAGLVELADEIREALAAERRRLDQRYALEELDIESREGLDAFERLRDAESQEHRFEEDLTGWLCEALGFERKELSGDTHRLQWTRRTRIPEQPGWKERFDSALGRPLTYHRRTAIANPEVRLVRPGFSLVDEMVRLMRRDERGTVFATWRPDARWPSTRGEWLGFRLTYVVELDEERLRELLEAHDSVPFPPVQRTARDLFVPWLETRTYDTNMEEVRDPLLLQILERDYDRDVDHNLGSRPDLIESIVGRDRFAILCREVRARSEELLRQEQDFIERFDRSKTAALDVLATQEASLSRRMSALESLGETDPAIARRQMVIRDLQTVAASPRLRLEAIGAYVVSRDAPSPAS